ncbi:AMP-binding protein [Streptomyces sp. NPDC001941]|uniref:AMP-binding protein n=1 Tax=Streptomyces sp. NPDC001941 TaxID=3154659 RepID=UPI00332F0E02
MTARSCFSVPELIRAQVEDRPTGPALRTAQGVVVTYAELWERAEDIARELGAMEVRPGDTVAVRMPIGPDAVVALLGSWLAGAAFLPLDLDTTTDRTRRFLDHARAIALIDVDAGLIPLEPSEWTESGAYPACVLPGGVLIGHAALAEHIDAIVDLLALTDRDTALQLAPLSEGVAQEEIWPVLAAGGTLTFADTVTPEGAELADLIQKRGVTVLQLPATEWQKLSAGGPGEAGDLSRRDNSVAGVDLSRRDTPGLDADLSRRDNPTGAVDLSRRDTPAVAADLSRRDTPPDPGDLSRRDNSTADDGVSRRDNPVRPPDPSRRDTPEPADDLSRRDNPDPGSDLSRRDSSPLAEVGPSDALDALDLLVVRGGALTPDDVRAHRSGPLRHVTLVHAHGSPETLFTSAALLLPPRAPLPEGEVLPLGGAVGARRLYVLDEQRRPVLPGEPGEVWVAGPVLAEGYLHDRTRTDERFVPEPFGAQTLTYHGVITQDRMYRTGDRARQRPDGLLELLETAPVSDSVSITVPTVPLLPGQARWMYDVEVPEPDHSCRNALFTTADGIGVERLERVADVLLRRHPALGSRLRSDRSLEFIEPDSSDAVRVLDFSGVAPDERVWQLEEALAAAQRSLSLSQGHVFRITYVELGDGTARLLLTVHELVIDQISLSLLVEELEVLLDEGTEETAKPPAPAPATPVDLSGALRDWLATADARADAVRWAAAVRGFAEIRPAAEGDDRILSLRTHRFRLPAEETRLVVDDLGARGITPQDFVLGSLVGGLAAWTGESTHGVDVVVDGRDVRVGGLDLSLSVGHVQSTFPAVLSWVGEGLLALRGVLDELAGLPAQRFGFDALRFSSPYENERTALTVCPRPAVRLGFHDEFRDEFVARSARSDRLLRPAAESLGAQRSPAQRERHLLLAEGALVDGELQFGITYSQGHWSYAHITALVAHVERVMGEVLSPAPAAVGASGTGATGVGFGPYR